MTWSRKLSTSLLSRLGGLVGHVFQALSGTADELMRAGFHVDRGDIRQFLANVGLTSGGLVAGLAAAPPYVVAVDAATIFAALEEATGRSRPAPPPLPEPVVLERAGCRRRSTIPTRSPIEAEQLHRTTPLVDFVVQESWSRSFERHVALIDAYDRFPAGMPALEHQQTGGYDQVNRHGVDRITRADVKPRHDGSRTGTSLTSPTVMASTTARSSAPQHSPQGLPTTANSSAPTGAQTPPRNRNSVRPALSEGASR